MTGAPGVVLLSGPYVEHAVGAGLILVVVAVAIGIAIHRADRRIAQEVDEAEARLRKSEPL